MTRLSSTDVRLSKFLSLVLRHRPERIGITLDEHGWADIDELVEAAARTGRRFTHEDLMRVVAGNDKQRFGISDDGRRIRARQGHTLAGVDVGLAERPPPAVLYHGTVERFLPTIRAEGLLPMRRHHVHLSADPATAERVGARRGRAVVLVVDAAGLAADGHRFRLSENGVWLTDHVPPAYLTTPA